MSEVLPASAIELINSGAHAHLATVNEDGWPQASLVWVTYEEGELRMAALTPRLKLRNLARDDRVSISWESPERDRLGLPYYLVVRGRGHVTDGGAPELLRRIAPRFLGPDTKFPRGDDPPDGFVVHIRPERIFGYGPWCDNA